MKHKEVIIAMGNGEPVEFYSDTSLRWHTSTDQRALNPMTAPNLEWRIKPKTIRVGNRDLPEPLRVAPANGDKFYPVETYIEFDDKWNYTWHSYTSQERWLRRGLLHSTKEAAEQWRDAFIELAGGEV